MPTPRSVVFFLFLSLLVMSATICHALDHEREWATDEDRQLVRDTIESGNLSKLQKLMTKRPELLKLSYGNKPILCFPIFYNRPKILRFLLDIGAELHPQGMRSALMCAVQLGEPPFNREAVKILFEYGALADDGNVPGEGERWTPYIEALINNDLEMAKLLLENGANGAYVSKYGENALTNILYLAHAARMDLETVQFAVEVGKADVNHVKFPGTLGALTPLCIAAKIGRRDIYDYLLSKGADQDFRDGSGNSPKDYLKKQ